MRRRYPKGFREEMILKLESLSPKLRYIDFAKENNTSLETLKTWIFGSRQKRKQELGLSKYRQKFPKRIKNREFL